MIAQSSKLSKKLINLGAEQLCYRLLILLLVPSGTLTLSYAGDYVINPSNTNIRFAIDNLKSSATTGGFYNIKGQLQYDASAKTGNISLNIPINSLQTSSKIIDKNLASVDFFDAQRYPSARFDSTKWYFSTNAASSNNASQVTKIEGNLTLHGETHPITLTASNFSCYVSIITKKEVCAGNFRTTIDRKKWHINKYTLFGLTKNLTLDIHVEASKQ